MNFGKELVRAWQGTSSASARLPASLDQMRWESKMSTTNLIRGNDDRAFPGLSTYQLSTIERQRLAEGLRHFQTFADDQFPSDVACQRLLAEIVADGILPQAAPGLNRVIEMARKDIVDCIYVTN